MDAAVSCRDCSRFSDTSGLRCGPCVAMPNKPNFTPRPRLLILGWARHGKDTVAEILRDDHGFNFQSSSMFCAERVMLPYFASLGRTYSSVEECFEDRVNHRATWHEQIKAYNHEDPTRLCREMFDEGYDLYVGMRSIREYEASRHLFGEVLWVDGSGRGLPPEPRSSMDIEFDPQHMAFVDNSGSLEDLRERVAGLIEVIS